MQRQTKLTLQNQHVLASRVNGQILVHLDVACGAGAVIRLDNLRKRHHQGLFGENEVQPLVSQTSREERTLP